MNVILISIAIITGLVLAAVISYQWGKRSVMIQWRAMVYDLQPWQDGPQPLIEQGYKRMGGK